MSRLLVVKGDKTAGDNLLATLASNQGALLSLIGLFELAAKKEAQDCDALARAALLDGQKQGSGCMALGRVLMLQDVVTTLKQYIK